MHSLSYHCPVPTSRQFICCYSEYFFIYVLFAPLSLLQSQTIFTQPRASPAPPAAAGLVTAEASAAVTASRARAATALRSTSGESLNTNSSHTFSPSSSEDEAPDCRSRGNSSRSHVSAMSHASAMSQRHPVASTAHQSQVGHSADRRSER